MTRAMERLAEMEGTPPSFDELNETADRAISMLGECEKLWVKIYGSLKAITDTIELHDHVAFKKSYQYPGRVFEVINFSHGEQDLPIIYNPEIGAIIADPNKLMKVTPK